MSVPIGIRCTILFRCIAACMFVVAVVMKQSTFDIFTASPMLVSAALIYPIIKRRGMLFIMLIDAVLFLIPGILIVMTVNTSDETSVILGIVDFLVMFLCAFSMYLTSSKMYFIKGRERTPKPTAASTITEGEHRNEPIIAPEGAKVKVWLFEDEQIRYFGEVVKADGINIRHGCGRFEDGTVKYDGEWRNNLRDGTGTEIKEGTIYLGSWKAGVKEGWFTVLRDGEIIGRGSYHNDVKDGLWYGQYGETIYFSKGEEITEDEYDNITESIQVPEGVFEVFEIVEPDQ